MLVAFDSSFLIPLFDSRWGDKGQLDPRIAHLLSTLDRAKATIVVPTPALSELLIGARDAAPRYLKAISISARFRVAPFDARAAVEAAAAHREAIDRRNKKEGSPSWDKVKYDRQILSIAIVEGASHLYSNDDDLKRISIGSPIEVLALDDLPEPPFGVPDPEDNTGAADLFGGKPES
jgi:predicted nucleic acid-binding protein